MISQAKSRLAICACSESAGEHDGQNSLRAGLVSVTVRVCGVHRRQVVERHHGGHVHADGLRAHVPIVRDEVAGVVVGKLAGRATGPHAQGWCGGSVESITAGGLTET
jgi:hypothetical protein